MAESENVWPSWMESVAESVNSFSCVITELVLMIFGTDSNTTSSVTTPKENIVDKYLFLLHNVAGSLAFDHFQMQLFKIFTIILISTAVLIFVAWHVYGLRISERFMHSNRDARSNSPCSVK